MLETQVAILAAIQFLRISPPNEDALDILGPFRVYEWIQAAPTKLPNMVSEMRMLQDQFYRSMKHSSHIENTERS